MVTIRRQLIADTSMKFGRSNPKRFLTIHETGNTSRGANAAAHANLQSRLWDWATWHWTVDDREAVQSYTHDFQLWHAGDGRGNGNMQSIAIETCVNSDANRAKIHQNLVELAGKIVAEEGIARANIVQHNHWSGKNCPTQIRANGEWSKLVAAIWAEAERIKGGGGGKPTPAPSPGGSKSVAQLADEVMAGKHGNGADRQRSLGSQYNAVQAEVNRRLYGGTGGGNPGNTNTSVSSLADAVMRGEYGNGDERRRRLGNNYAAVQAEVNRRLGIKTAAPSSGANIDALARAAIRGDYGNGAERQRRLGSNYAAVQARVNQILGIG